MIDSLCIDSVLLGTEKNLVIDDGYWWTTNVPASSWHLSGTCKLHSDRCLDTLLRLNNAVIDVSPPKRFVSAMSTLMLGSNMQVPWVQVMSERDHRAFMKNLINRLVEVFSTLSKDYYVNTWVPQAAVLRSLQPAKISKHRFEEVLVESGMNSRVVEGFRPGTDGYAMPITYDRFGTRTGRLTVESGPSILTVKKEYRDMITSAFPGGKIAYVDFAALEVRILLYETGGHCDEVDIYTHISQQAFGGSVSRKATKGAVISELYGSSKAALGAVLGIQGKELNEFVNRVKDFFQTTQLRKKIKDEFIKTGYITNRYGRKILIEDPLDHIFINSYAQSTGVDVSLLGFSSIVEQLQGYSGIRPLFVLHDALLLDVSPDCFGILNEIKKVNVPGYEQVFPLKVEFL